MKLPSSRVLNFAGALICAGMMAFALYSQYVLLMDPCPLCSLQRLAVILLGVTFLAAAIHGPRTIAGRVYAGLIAIFAVFGIGVAARHVWLQNLPAEEVPACGPGLSYMVDNFPFSDVLDMIFNGSGECAEISWKLLGLSMPAWVVVSMVGLGVAGVWFNLRSTDPVRT